VCFALSVAARSVVALYRRSARVGGLLARRRDPADERVLAVTLTDAGRGLRDEAEKVPAAIVARLGMDVVALESPHGAPTRLIATPQDVPGGTRSRAARGGGHGRLTAFCQSVEPGP
jgi:hypothetical protein